MIPESQREALSLLAEILSLSPDIRLGQLMSHLGFMGDCHFNRGLGIIEDDELLSMLYRHRDELLARSELMATDANGQFSKSLKRELVTA